MEMMTQIYGRREHPISRLDIDALNNVPYERVEDEIYKDEFESDFKLCRRKEEDKMSDAFCNGHAAVGLYASNDDSITARKVRLKCSRRDVSYARVFQSKAHKDG